MTSVLARVRQRLTTERGATMVEYGFMVMLVALVVLVAVGPLGTAVSTMFAGVPASL